MNVSERDAATAAAHNELACMYVTGQIEVQSDNGTPIDDVLWQLARKVATASVRTAMHHEGTEGFYDIQVPKAAY